MARRGFTLVELLVVIAIMGLLGTAAVGGYRQMQRGMEERGVFENANRFMRSAYQRSKIDRQPTAVVYWNECLRSRDENEDETEIVVGRAVAVRRYGRITAINGQWLADEFGDLERLNASEADLEGVQSSSSSKLARRLYRFDNSPNGANAVSYSLVTDTPEAKNPMLDYATSTPANPEHTIYGFRLDSTGPSVSWKVGDAYGFEFESIELPHNFIFGAIGYSTSADSPVAGDPKVIVFSPVQNSSATLPIVALRPGPDGKLTPVTLGDTDSPSKDPN